MENIKEFPNYVRKTAGYLLPICLTAIFFSDLPLSKQAFIIVLAEILLILAIGRKDLAVFDNWRKDVWSKIPPPLIYGLRGFMFLVSLAFPSLFVIYATMIYVQHNFMMDPVKNYYLVMTGCTFAAILSFALIVSVAIKIKPKK